MNNHPEKAPPQLEKAFLKKLKDIVRLLARVSAEQDFKHLSNQRKDKLDDS